jgi:hypothetical protein
LSELARRLNISWPRALTMHTAEAFGKPDAVASTTGGHTYLFKESRVEQIRALVKNWGLERAIKANAARQRK